MSTIDNSNINAFGGNTFRGMSFEEIEKEYMKKKTAFQEKYGVDKDDR